MIIGSRRLIENKEDLVINLAENYCILGLEKDSLRAEHCEFFFCAHDYSWKVKLFPKLRSDSSKPFKSYSRKSLYHEKEVIEGSTEYIISNHTIIYLGRHQIALIDIFIHKPPCSFGDNNITLKVENFTPIDKGGFANIYKVKANIKGNYILKSSNDKSYS